MKYINSSKPLANKLNVTSGITVLNKSMITLLFFCTGIGSSFADSTPVVAGKTLLAKGSVNAVVPSENGTNESRALKRRSKIMSVDHITTGANSKAQFSMSDGGLITLKENTEINVSNYVFDNDTQKGSATLEVISGGLRSISGLIKKTGGDYQVKTPVGSIGIRGTHFAVEVVGDDVFFGVYSGNIDIDLNNNETLSLGVTEGFAFASVNQSGEVTSFSKAPEVLSLAFVPKEAVNTGADSEDTADSDSKTASNPNSNPNSNSSTTANNRGSAPLSSPSNGAAIQTTVNVANNSVPPTTDNFSNDIDTTNSEFTPDVYTELEIEEINNEAELITATIADLLSERTGTFNYQEITQNDINSTAGGASNLSLNLAINFDNGTVPGGALSLTDAQGEWFATYSGLINVDQLELGVNFASHANQRAEGNISAAFSDGLSEITGNFDLQEVEDPSVKATGSFKIK